MTFEEWAATIVRGVTINPQMAFEAQQKRIVDLEQATDLAIQINNDLTSQLEHLERERDAAFAMSRCECEANECCANLVKLHDRIAELEALLKEGATGFGRILVATSDDAAVRDWQKRAKAAIAKGEK